MGTVSCMLALTIGCETNPYTGRSQFLMTSVEEEMQMAALAKGSIQEALTILEEEITPIDDLRSTAHYRRRVAANLLARFWNDTAS